MKESIEWAEKFAEFLKENNYPEIEHGILVSWFSMAMDSKIKKNGPSISGIYKNYRGETSIRDIVPYDVAYENNEYHGEGYVLKAYDVDKKEYRDFALGDFNFATLNGFEHVLNEEHKRILYIASGESAIYEKVDTLETPCLEALSELASMGYIDVTSVYNEEGDPDLVIYKITYSGINRLRNIGENNG